MLVLVFLILRWVVYILFLKKKKEHFTYKSEREKQRGWNNSFFYDSQRVDVLQISSNDHLEATEK